MAESTIITALCWVSRGYAKPVLEEEYEPTKDELMQYDEITTKAGVKGKGVTEMTKEIEKSLADMNLDKYDQEDEVPIFTSELKILKGEDQDMDDNEDDIEEGSSESVSSFGEGDEEGKKNKRDNYPTVLEDSEEEKEDYTIRKSDSLIVAATAENDHSSLEVYIYDHKNSNVYVHHEIILSSYPLCMEWLPVYGGQKSNLIIVGTFLPQIEIWNLDREDPEPVFCLGDIIDEDEQKKKKKKSLINQFSKKGQALTNQNDQTHTDSVLSLSLNPVQREYLASGSADCTVKIWDLEEQQCKASLNNLHKNKVQVVKWNNVNDQLLLTGGYDRVMNVVDVRERPLGNNAIKYRLKKEVKDLESAQWHPTLEHFFAVSTESGVVQGYDIRNPEQPAFSYQAHEKSCTNISFSPHIPNMLATCSLDEHVKIWDINSGAEPKLIGYKKTTMGELFSLSFYNDIPWVLAAGGSKGEIAVWDTEEQEKVQAHFTPFLDKTRIPEEQFDDEPEEKAADEVEDEDESEEEERKQKKKSNKKAQISKLDHIQQGINKAKELKKKQKAKK